MVIGIILLFFGAGVLPSVGGKLVAPTIDDNTVNHSTMKITLIIIGILTDKLNSGKNVFNYVIVLGYEWTFKDGKYLKYPDSGPIIDSLLDLLMVLKLVFLQTILFVQYFSIFLSRMRFKTVSMLTVSKDMFLKKEM